jgi:pantothenate kinase
MKTIQVRLPENVHSRAKRLSREEQVSMNQFIVTSISNEIVREETSDFFRKAASAFDAKAFAEALAAVPDAAPVAGDEMP